MLVRRVYPPRITWGYGHGGESIFISLSLPLLPPPDRSSQSPRPLKTMWLIEVVNYCRALIAIIGFTLSLRFLLPRNVVPHVSAVLRETLALLDRAEAIGAIPLASEIRKALASCATDFLVTQMESHRSPGILQQLVLAVRVGLTYKTYDLYLRITAIRTEIQLAMDLVQLESLTTMQSSTTTALPTVDVAARRVSKLPSNHSLSDSVV